MRAKEVSYLPCLEKVAITGGTGFIGGHLVRHLVLSGCRPTLLGRFCKHSNLESDLEDHISRVPCDITDSESVRVAIENEKPQTLFHLAGTRGSGEGAECAVLNFHGTASLLEVARRNRVRRIVLAGSAEEYGNQPGPLGEWLSLKPCSQYGNSKALATWHALALYARQECPVVVVRPFSVYGPGQPHEMFIAQAVERAVRNARFEMSLGEQKRDLVFVDDVVRGLISAAIVPHIEGRVVNLGTGRAYRLREVARRIWEMSGSSAPLIIGALQPGTEELCDTWADTTMAREILDWEAEIDLDEGL